MISRRNFISKAVGGAAVVTLGGNILASASEETTLHNFGGFGGYSIIHAWGEHPPIEMTDGLTIISLGRDDSRKIPIIEY
jgi:hypothetical protein